MVDTSEEAMIKDCPHCDPDSFALKQTLEETDSFLVVCDVHPLVEGHLLIIPKDHISCIGKYSSFLLSEFEILNTRVSEFLRNEYGSVATFEHGIIGQTVFHSHVHLMPFTGTPESIVPEGEKFLVRLNSISDIQEVFNKEGQYLYFTVEKQMWLVDSSLGAPRFFRDRFAKALGEPERGNWKVMHESDKLMLNASREIERLRKHWKKILF